MLSEDKYSRYAAYTEEEDELEDWPGDPRTPSRHFHRRALTDDEDLEDDHDEHDLPLPDTDEPSQGFATHTAFDAYFQLASKPARTSANVFSALLPALSPDEFAGALSTARQTERTYGLRPALWDDARTRGAAYRRFRWELDEGFNLLFYGCGSKRVFLNAFAGWLAEEGAHVVVANGFQPSFAFRDLLGAIERVPGVLGDEGESSAGGLDAQVQRIHAFFSQTRHLPSTASSFKEDSGELPHLYIVIHNIEGAAFRAPKHRSALALLALAPRIHLCASFDHVVGAPLRWSLSDIFARKPDALSPSSPSPSVVSPTPSTSNEQRPLRGPSQKRGFAWLWHDLTTLAPYDFELAYADPTVLTGASALRGARAPAASSAAAAGPGASGAGRGAMTETAARHILASVTQKAKKLFVLLGTKQLEVMDASQPAPGAEAEAEEAYDYDRLFAAARDNFVAQNDTALRALLGEFRDHGLVVARPAPGDAGEALWIPLRRDALFKVVADLTAEGA